MIQTRIRDLCLSLGCTLRRWIHLKARVFLNHIAGALITLGFAASTALPGWEMKQTDQQRQSILLRLLVVKSIQEGTAGATIVFQTGEKGTLPRNRKEYQSHLIMAQRSAERAYPVGVRIDGAGEIGEIARADSDYVKSVADEQEDKVKVGLQMHDGIAYLERQHPRFESLRRDLNRSLKEKKRIWFVWRLPSLMLDDVMLVEEDVSATGTKEKLQGSIQNRSQH